MKDDRTLVRTRLHDAEVGAREQIAHQHYAARTAGIAVEADLRHRARLDAFMQAALTGMLAADKDVRHYLLGSDVDVYLDKLVDRAWLIARRALERQP